MVCPCVEKLGGLCVPRKDTEALCLVLWWPMKTIPGFLSHTTALSLNVGTTLTTT